MGIKATTIKSSIWSFRAGYPGGGADDGLTRQTRALTPSMSRSPPEPAIEVVGKVALPAPICPATPGKSPGPLGMS
jgi:hypothetical protein